MLTLDTWRLWWLHLFSTTIFLRISFHRIWVSTWSPVQLVYPRPSIRKNGEWAEPPLNFILYLVHPWRFDVFKSSQHLGAKKTYADELTGSFCPLAEIKSRDIISRISLVRLTLGKWLNLPNCSVLSIFFYPDGKRKF